MSLRGKVAVLRTSPETVLEDYARLLELAGFRQVLSPDRETILKTNISWHTWYPACSTTPWQYEGVVKALLDAGFARERVIPAYNRTVVVDDKVGLVNNKLGAVEDKYGLKRIHLYEPPIRWEVHTPKRPFRVLSQVFPDGVKIPTWFAGRDIIHFPTTKTHVFTTTTGAMKNAFGGLLSERRHWTHGVIHETLVDLLQIQQEIHPGILAVMDGTIAGDGPGPRAMIPHVKNYILASADQVAIDALAAKMMGFDPMKLDYIRLAHEDGLGVGNPSEMEVVGEDVSKVNYGFRQTDTFASKGQKMIYHGCLKRFENILLRTPIVPWSYAASRLYHDAYWYPCVGARRVQAMLETPWGRLFQSYQGPSGTGEDHR